MKKWIWIAFLASLFACNDSEIEIPIGIEEDFKPYISAYTSGRISKGGMMSVYFKKDLPDTVLNDTQLLRSAIKVTPAFDFRIATRSNKAIIIDPIDDLKSGTRYRIDVNVADLIQEEIEPAVFPMVFETIQQDFRFEKVNLKPVDIYEPNILELDIEIKTDDKTSLEEVKKIVRSMGKYDVEQLQWVQYGDQSYGLKFRGLERKEQMTSFTIEADGASIGAERKLSHVIEIPPKMKFQMTRWSYESYPDQVLSVEFSEPLKKEQDLKGLISIDHIRNFTYAIDQNKVNLFLNNSFVGNTRLVVHRGIRSFHGEATETIQDDTIYIDPPQPTVELLGEGTILPNSQGLIVPFKTIGLKKVDVDVFRIHEDNVLQFLQVNEIAEKYQLRRVADKVASHTIDLQSSNGGKLQQWTTHGLDLKDIMQPQPGAIYRVRFSFSQSYTFAHCEESSNTSYYSEYRDYYENSSYSDREDYELCDNWFYYHSTKSKNLLSTDLGLIIKSSDNRNFDLVTTNLITGQPRPHVKVEFYTYAQKLMRSAVTNEQGLVKVQLSDAPFVAIATDGRHKTYLKLDRGYSNSLSKFETEGVTRSDGVDAFFYGERGVWRPGDKIFMTCAVRDEFNKLRDGQPVKVTFSNPKGQTVSEITLRLNTKGLMSIPLETDLDAPTGYYQLSLTTGGYNFNRSIKIESIRPNRLKIDIAADNDEIMAQHDPRIGLSSVWLHGAKADGLKANVTMRLRSVATRFKKFSNYQFEDAAKRSSDLETVIFDGTLNEEGKADIPLRLEELNARGKLSAQFITKVFEQGGGFSIDNVSIPYHAYDHYIGFKLPVSEYGDIITGKKNRIEIVAVTPKGELSTKERHLKLRVYKIEWRWWWQHNAEDLASYVSNNSYNLIAEAKLKTKAGKTHYDLDIPEHRWGQYYIQVVDEDGGHSSGQVYFADYWGSERKVQDRSSALLVKLHSSKPRYETNEEAKVHFHSPAPGKALISIENDIEVVKSFWVNTVGGANTVTVPVTSAMSPNCYIHITLLQPHVHKGNDKPIRMYGVVPVEVFDPMTVLEPQINMSDEIRPDEATSITVSEKTGRGMYYTVAIVDEGLLDLTRFKTPNIWRYFNKKRALGVYTWDIYDEVVNAFSGKFENVYKVGGDGSGVEGNIAKANRFKPVVKYLGPFYLAPGQRAKHNFTIENYVGSVKAMVVCRNGNAFGNTDKEVKVRKPIMVQLNAPRTITPGDEVMVPVTVFANEQAKLPATITLSATNGAQVEQPKITINDIAKGETTVFFKVKAGKQLGMVKFKAHAQAQNDQHEYSEEVPVRLPGFAITKVGELNLKDERSGHFNINPIGWLGTNHAVLEVSQYPSIDLERRMKYLIRYPHGCIEQTTSSVFPQLYLSTLVELDPVQRKKIDINIREGIERLKKFATLSGGFSYWPGDDRANEWGTSYAGHFLIEAKAKGYYVPDHLLDGWYTYQTSQVNNYSAMSERPDKELMQAYRLYTLARYGKPDLGAMNRMKEHGLQSNAAKWRLATAYALIGQKVIANHIVASVSYEVKPYRDHAYTYGSEYRDLSMILESMHLLNHDRLLEVMKKVADGLGGKRWLSTQETAYALLAYAQVVGNMDTSPAEFEYSDATGNKERISMSKPTHQIDLGSFDRRMVVRVSNKSGRPLFFKVINTGTPSTLGMPNAHNGLEIKVTYHDLKGELVKREEMKYGKDYRIKVKVTNTLKGERLSNLALTVHFPSGTEIQNDRMLGSRSYGADYEDIRDDRIHAYFGLTEGQSRTFTYTFTTSYKGDYLDPGIYCEAMYDASISAMVGGRMIELK